MHYIALTLFVPCLCALLSNRIFAQRFSATRRLYKDCSGSFSKNGWSLATLLRSIGNCKSENRFKKKIHKRIIEFSVDIADAFVTSNQCRATHAQAHALNWNVGTSSVSKSMVQPAAYSKHGCISDFYQCNQSYRRAVAAPYAPSHTTYWRV